MQLAHSRVHPMWRSKMGRKREGSRWEGSILVWETEVAGETVGGRAGSRRWGLNPAVMPNPSLISPGCLLESVPPPEVATSE